MEKVSMRLALVAVVLAGMMLAGQEAHAARPGTTGSITIPKSMISCSVLGNCEDGDLGRPAQQANNYTRGCRAADRCRG